MSELFRNHGNDYKKGDYLFFDGEKGNEMFVILDGTVDVIKGSKGHEKVLATLRKGEFFGEMAILNNCARSATAKISSEVAKLLVIDNTTFDSMIRGNVEIAVKMLEKVSERLYYANVTIENLLLKNPETKIVHYMKEILEKRHPGKEQAIITLSMGQIASATFIPELDVKKIVSKLAKTDFLDQVGQSKFMIKNVNEFNDFFDYLYKKERFTGIF